MKNPIIGITLDFENNGGYSNFPWYAIRENYLTCLYKFGAIPFPLFHQNSLNEYFPKHEVNFNMIVHRPSEECYISVWYIVKDNYVEVLPFEDMERTQLDHSVLIDLIFKIDNRNPYIAA